ncbi:MAG: LysR family transcriptional regulator [Actinomycetia bacterium]|nr:LysR family transcriptional regulator [Actinomycetes bacterium]
MKDSLKPGVTYSREVAIDKDRTIAFMGDDLRVYSTPSMVLDIEQTCRELLLDHHDEGEDSVGARVEVDHLGATLLGQTVTVTATVVEVDGPRSVFEVEVHDEVDKVGQGKHIRFAIDTAKQGQRLEKKRARVAEAAG